ncbi:DUF3817 domain-containing protein [Pedobacter sp. UBA4863]|uniref:DUF3817 domain-containing protein n=1 Tax=Pedobacter sp. UBA4863 TaxID=1947060 RepID=UPI0025FCA03D|nr:DUF3817 domain-containing protein [Pedobacter sp. UBA4863]
MSSLNLFRKVALAEGISYIVLLFIAMPLKYWADMPLAVKYVGWAHGLLFVLYIACLVMAWQERKWSFGRVIVLFIASLLPFVPFYVEKKLKEEESIAN